MCHSIAFVFVCSIFCWLQMRFREKFSWCPPVAMPYTQKKLKNFKEREKKRDCLNLFEKKDGERKTRGKTVQLRTCFSNSLCLSCSKLHRDLGSISSTCLSAAFTCADPESAKSCLT